MSNAVGPVALKERIEILDVLRGFAVCGILIGNMQWFSGYGMMPPAVVQRGAAADQITHFLVHCHNTLVETMHLRCKTLVATHLRPC